MEKYKLVLAIPFDRIYKGMAGEHIQISRFVLVMPVNKLVLKFTYNSVLT